MEYIVGIKLTDQQAMEEAGLDRRTVAENSINFVLQQIFESHLFHTDPHPGNLFLMPGNVVCLIDFGQAARMILRTRELLMEWIKAIFDRDAQAMLRAFRHVGAVTDETNMEQLTLDVEEMIDYFCNAPVEEFPFHDFVMENMELIRRHQLNAPPGFALILKSLLIVESVGRWLTPEYPILPTLESYVQRYRRLEMKPQQTRRFKDALFEGREMVIKMPGHINTILGKMRHGEFSMQISLQRLEKLIDIVDVSVKCISGAIIIAALLLASSFLVGFEGTVLGVVNVQTLGVLGYILAVVLGLWLIVVMIRRPK